MPDEKDPHTESKDATEDANEPPIWERKAIIATMAWVWIAFFALTLQQGILGAVINNAYSSFHTAPAIATAGILSTVVAAGMKLPTARLLLVWGRAQCLAVFTALFSVGLIVLATCTGPDGYAAGSVLYKVGYLAIYLILDVFVADVSGLKNRAFAFAFAGTPFLCTAFAAPQVAKAFLQHSSWRWAIGVFAIIMPAVLVPLIAIFWIHQKKEQQQGAQSLSSRPASVASFIHDLDLVGCALLMAGFILVLLPFSLQSYHKIAFQSAAFPVMIVFGVLCLALFGLWEWRWAATPFLPWHFLRNRSLVGGCLCAAIVSLSTACWSLNYFNANIVMYNLEIDAVGYMLEINSLGSCFWSVIVGLWVRWTRRFKYMCLFLGLPLMALGVGLFVYFYGEQKSVGLVVMASIFISFGTGTLFIGNDMSAMAPSGQHNTPMALALIGLVSNIGGAIGSAVAAAIYSHTFPSTLQSALPEDLKKNATSLYLAGYVTQMRFKEGSPVREAVNYTWGRTQRMESIAGTAILALAIPCIVIWHNYKLTDTKRGVAE